MRLTDAQLETIKAANHQKSLAWEAERFTDGNIVLIGIRFTAIRKQGAWVDNDTKQTYATLSRWGRSKYPSYNPKRSGTFLKVDNKYVQISLLEPLPAPTPTPTPTPAQCLEDRIKGLEERLLATATATIFLKQRVEALEARQPVEATPQLLNVLEIAREKARADVEERTQARVNELLNQ